MRGLISLCVRRAGAVAALSLLALSLGIWRVAHAPLDVFPEFVPSQVDIQTEAPGFTPLQVEELVTKRIESAVNGASGLATLRSESIPGLSVVTVTFDDRIDLHVAREGISERLSELGNTLPAGSGAPRLSPLVSSTMDLLKIGLLSKKLDAYALRDVADWVIKPRLLAVPGVARAVVFGGSVRQIQIAPDLKKLASYGLTLTDVTDGARAALALRGAGFIDLQAQRVLLTLPTPSPDIETLGLGVITVRSGVPIRLNDVAAIAEAPAPRAGDSLVMGRRGVMMALASQYGANTLTTTLAAEKVLSELEPELRAQGIEVYPRLHRPASFIESALGHLEQSLAIAAVLIMAVLFLFLRDWRAALIAFTAIPLSLCAAVVVLAHYGQTLNTMTLGGLAVALGVLVDDAIIDLENIIRRLHATTDSRLPARIAVITEASLEVRGPVVYATIVVIAIFMPELFTSSMQGHFVGPLALAFVLAVLASLAVAITVTPALCALLLPHGRAGTEARWLSRLKRIQGNVVLFAMAHLPWIVGALAAAVAAAVITVPMLGGVFMPDFREGHFVLQVSSSSAGTSLDEMLELGAHISADILKLRYVKTVEQQVGRAEQGEDTWGVHQSEFHVELQPDTAVDQTAAEAALRSILQQYPGIQSEVVTFLGDRISESLTGDTAQVSINVYGNDLDALDRVGGQIAALLTRVDGIVDLQFKQQSRTPTIAIEPLPRALSALGLTNQQVADAVQTAYNGTTVGQTYAGARSVDVALSLPQATRQRPEELAKLLVSGPFGPVPLERLARITVRMDRYRIEHDGGQRRAAISFNVQRRDLQATVLEARRRIARSVVLPSGFFLEFAGAAAAASATQNQLLLYTALAVAVIVMVLSVAFRWRANSWLVLVNLPFSLIGGVLAIATTGIGISLGSALGLVTVFGISARNAILLLAHYEHLVHGEGLPWTRDTVLRGANERLVPILMTAMVTALGLAPLALGADHPGEEIEGPMAIAVLGGLLTSTLLNLLILPALAQRLARPR